MATKTFTLQTKPQDLFGAISSYWLVGNLSVTTNDTNRNFTVTVSNVYSMTNSNTTYDFGQHIYVGFGTTYDSAKADANKRGQVALINRSGSANYSGRLPKNGATQQVGVSKTFNYNNDGTTPEVYCYLRAMNSSVHWISQNVQVFADTHTIATKNVTGTAYITDKIPKLVATKPIIKLSNKIEKYTQIGVTASVTNGVTVSSWESKLDNGNWVSKTSSTTSYKVSGGTHKIYVRAKSKSNVYSDVSEISFDCRKPNVTNYSLTPTTSNKGTLTLNVNVPLLLVVGVKL